MNLEGSNCNREPLLGDSFPHHAAHSTARQSFASRISTHVARRLSVVGVVEEPRNGSVAGAAINTLCNVIGAGVLSLPLAMYEASILGGLVLMMYTSLLAGFSVFVVIAGCDATQRFSFTEVFGFLLVPSITFEEFCALKSHAISGNSLEVGKGAMEVEELRVLYIEDDVRRRKRRRIVILMVESIIFLNNYGSLIVYSRVIADSIPPVVEHFLHGSGLVITRGFWLLISGVVFFFLSSVRNMDELKWTSILGFLTIFYIIVTILARYFTSRRNPPYPNVDPIARGEINFYHVGVGIFRTMSTYGVAFGYHYNAPYFYRELQNRTPANMMKSVYIAFPIIVVCYAITGVFGYLTFGEMVTSTNSGGDIVRNYPDDDPVMNVGRLGLFFHFACVYPILSVCARRGLHRLIMNALMWSSQTALIEAEAGGGVVGQSGQSIHGGQKNFDDNSSGAMSTTNDIRLSIGLDRDVGSPEDTTRLAIICEAFFLVCTTVSMAAVISGISVMIDFLGTLLGVSLMLTLPGVIAWFLFSRVELVGTTPYRCARLKMGLSLLLIATGILFTIVGTAFLIQNYAM